MNGYEKSPYDNKHSYLSERPWIATQRGAFPKTQRRKKTSKFQNFLESFVMFIVFICGIILILSKYIF